MMRLYSFRFINCSFMVGSTPETTSPKEVTTRGTILGILLAALLGAANAYLGLKVGLTVSASIPAAIISMTLLRLWGNTDVLENNIVQTTASAGQAVAAGVVFVLPALVILRYWHNFPYLDTAMIAACGGTLGVLFTIPLRKVLLVKSKELKFPEGVATAEILRLGRCGNLRDILTPTLSAALFKISQTGLKLLADSCSGAVAIGGRVFAAGIEFSVSLLGVGYILGLNVSLCILVGALISWTVAVPLMGDFSQLIGSNGDLYTAARELWKSEIRYMGLGAMFVGGIWTLLNLVGSIKEGLQASIRSLLNKESKSNVPLTERDISPKQILYLSIIVGLALFFLLIKIIGGSSFSTYSLEFWPVVGFSFVFAFLAGFLFSAVGGYMAGLVGSSNNPISSVSIITILLSALGIMLFVGSSLSGEALKRAGAAAIICGAIASCGAAIAGDNMQDLKAGQILGATPFKQQLMLIVGVIGGAFTVAPVLDLLYSAYGLGGVLPRPDMSPDEMLAAPQASLVKTLVEAVFAGELNWKMISVGIFIALGVIAMDLGLRFAKQTIRIPVLSVAMGMYLPIELTVPMCIGGVIHFLVQRNRKDKSELNSPQAPRNDLLYVSGLIAGEAIAGILLAIPFAISHSTDMWRILPTEWSGLSLVLGIVAFGWFITRLFRTSQRISPSSKE